MSSEATVTVEDRGDHLVATLSNPGRRNALAPSFHPALRQALDRAGSDSRIGAVILTGADGYFCAGGDLNALAARRSATEDERRANIDVLHDTVRAIMSCPCPVIAAVEGGAAGAGFSIALACDLVVAAEDAVFAAAYVRVGLVPDGGLTGALARRVPAGTAARICLTGDPVSAVRLAELGVVTDLAPPGEALTFASKLAVRLAHGPASAQTAIKQMLAQAYDHDTQTQFNVERDRMATALGGPEAAIGLAARLARETPDFRRDIDPKGDAAS